MSLSTSKSLGIDQARMSSSGFPFYVPPQHLHPGLLPSQVHTQGHLQLPFTRHRYSISRCPGSTTWQDSPQARRYSSSVDATLTLHAPKAHTQHAHTPPSPASQAKPFPGVHHQHHIPDIMRSGVNNKYSGVICKQAGKSAHISERMRKAG